MHAELLIIGSELTSGEKLDTNGQWLCQRLADLGVPVRFSTLLGDNLQDNVNAFQTAADRSDVVVTSGGLGPTQDDLTREALAKAAGVGLVEDTEALRAIEAMFRRRNREMPDRNRVQALIPLGATIIRNDHGTAPGIWLRTGRASIACLPGVPRELKAMFDEQVAPRVRALLPESRTVVRRVINIFGKGESEVEAMAPDITARGRIPEVGITASDATISLRICGEGSDEAKARDAIESTAALIYERFGNLIVGEGDENVTEGLVRELQRSKSTISTAESCTGGLIAQRLTLVPGISAFFPGGLVTYSVESKVELLGLPRELIETHGVVSAEVAEAMAINVRNKFGTDMALSSTGVAGPGGGTPKTPVGTVYIALATAQGSRSERLDLGAFRPRSVIQSWATKFAHNLARLELLDEEGD